MADRMLGKLGKRRNAAASALSDKTKYKRTGSHSLDIEDKIFAAQADIHRIHT